MVALHADKTEKKKASEGRLLISLYQGRDLQDLDVCRLDVREEGRETFVSQRVVHQ